MNKILIVGALSQEINAIKEVIKNLKLRNIKTSFLTTGMGNYNMILNLTRFLEKEEKYDFLINIGVCGYVNNNKKFIQVGRVFNLSNNQEFIIPNLISYGDIVSIATSEKIVYNANELGGEEYIDMESYGFEKVCDSFNLPRIILKIPVDKIGDETKNFDYKKAEKYLRENIDYKELLAKISDYLEKNQLENKDLTKYNNYFKFSFTQAIIFEKLFNKFEILTGEDFENYFYKYIRGLEKIENSKQESKKFLEDLEKYLEDK